MGHYQIRLLTDAQVKVPVGYTTHNGAEFRVCYAQNRDIARRACELANADKSLTLKQRSVLTRRIVADLSN